MNLTTNNSSKKVGPLTEYEIANIAQGIKQKIMPNSSRTQNNSQREQTSNKNGPVKSSSNVQQNINSHQSPIARSVQSQNQFDDEQIESQPSYDSQDYSQDDSQNSRYEIDNDMPKEDDFPQWELIETQKIQRNQKKEVKQLKVHDQEMSRLIGANLAVNQPKPNLLKMIQPKSQIINQQKKQNRLQTQKQLKSSSQQDSNIQEVKQNIYVKKSAKKQIKQQKTGTNLTTKTQQAAGQSKGSQTTQNTVQKVITNQNQLKIIEIKPNVLTPLPFPKQNTKNQRSLTPQITEKNVIKNQPNVASQRQQKQLAQNQSNISQKIQNKGEQRSKPTDTTDTIQLKQKDMIQVKPKDTIQNKQKVMIQNKQKDTIQSKPNTNNKQKAKGVFLSAIEIKTKSMGQSLKRRECQKRVWKQMLKKDLPILNKEYITQNVFQDISIQETVYSVIVEQFNNAIKKRKQNDIPIQVWNDFEQDLKSNFKKEMIQNSYIQTVKIVNLQLSRQIKKQENPDQRRKWMKMLATNTFKRIKSFMKATFNFMEQIIFKRQQNQQLYMQAVQIHKNKQKSLKKIQKFINKFQETKINFAMSIRLLDYVYSGPLLMLIDKKYQKTAIINQSKTKKCFALLKRIEQSVAVCEYFYQQQRHQLKQSRNSFNLSEEEVIQTIFERHNFSLRQNQIRLRNIQYLAETKRKEPLNYDMQVKNISIKSLNSKLPEFLFQDQEIPAFAPSQNIPKLTLKKQQTQEDIHYKKQQSELKTYSTQQKIWSQYGWQWNNRLQASFLKTEASQNSIIQKLKQLKITESRHQDIARQPQILAFQSEQAKYQELSAFLLFNTSILQQFTNQQILFITNKEFRKRYSQNKKYEVKQKSNQLKLRQLYLTGYFNGLNLDPKKIMPGYPKINKSQGGDFVRLSDGQKHYLSQQYKKLKGIKKQHDLSLPVQDLTFSQKAYLQKKWSERQMALQQIRKFRQKQMTSDIRNNLKNLQREKQIQEANHGKQQEQFDQLALINQDQSNIDGQQQELQNQRAYYMFKQQNYFNQQSTKTGQDEKHRKQSLSERHQEKGFSLKKIKNNKSSEKKGNSAKNKEQWWLQTYGKKTSKEVDQMEFLKYGWLYKNN